MAPAPDPLAMSKEERIAKMREQREAKAQARLEKLREINRKKYSINDTNLPTAVSKISVSSVASGTSKSDSNVPKNAYAARNDKVAKNTNPIKSYPRKSMAPQIILNKERKDIDIVKNRQINGMRLKTSNPFNDKNKVETTVQTNNHVCGDIKNINDVAQNLTGNQICPFPKLFNNDKDLQTEEDNNKTNTNDNRENDIISQNEKENVNGIDEVKYVEQSYLKIVENDQAKEDKSSTESKTVNHGKYGNFKSSNPTSMLKGIKKLNANQINNLNSRKSIAVVSKVNNKPKPADRRMTMVPQTKEKSCSTTNVKESVFDRLYKPRVVQKQPIDNVTKLKTDPNYFKKVVKDSQMITSRRTTMKKETEVRRSISAIHFKRVPKNELSNCIHKWASIGDNIDKDNIQDINEDETLKEEKIISAVKSERKRVKFQTPLPLGCNTPTPEELHLRLQKWLKKRGKSLDSYHHLQCFGLHHLSNYNLKPLDAPKFDDEDENKENIALEHDSDNDSFLDNNNRNGNLEEGEISSFPADKWRRTSSVTDTSEYNDSCLSTITSVETVHHVDELLQGALNDLTELLREGFAWEQCARWLRALRERFPSAPDTAPYWECRAALEERRGDLHATVQCMEEALAKGTAKSVVEANLDNLMDKFMQLKISPNCDNTKSQKDKKKLMDVKNVFVSTVIRFAVQKAKLRQSSGTPQYTVTPVRRSHRLSRTHTPLQVCSSLQQAKQLGAHFRINKALTDTP